MLLTSLEGLLIGEEVVWLLLSLFLLLKILNFCKIELLLGGSSLDELFELNLLLELLCLLKCSAESMDCGGTSDASTKAEGKLALEGIDFDGFLHLKHCKISC